MKTIAIGAACALLAVGVVVPANAASYDGTWQVTGTPQSVRCPGYTMTMVVAGNHLTGTVGLSKATVRLAGTVAPDGSFQAQNTASVRATGHFSGDTVNVELTDNLCTARAGTGQRSK